MTPTEHAEFVAATPAKAAHNARERNRPVTYGQLTCVCESTEADPAVNWGECPRCRRVPLRLFRSLRGVA